MCSSDLDDSVELLLRRESNEYCLRYVGESLVGVVVYCGCTVYLICVHPEFQRRGIGTALLEAAEDAMSRRCFEDTIHIGAGDGYIFPGVPKDHGMNDWFLQRGYIHDWGDCGCFDMDLDLTQTSENYEPLESVISGIRYRYAKLTDREALLTCVAEGEVDFVPYYEEEEQYEDGTKTPILVAVDGEQIVGAIMIDMGTRIVGEGTVGCTVTHPQYRGKGIATYLVRIATGILKAQGLERASLQYTYTDILKLYQRSGYQVSKEYYMAAEKMEKG